MRVCLNCAVDEQARLVGRVRQNDGLDAFPKITRAQLQYRHLSDELAIRRRSDSHRARGLLRVQLLVGFRQGRSVRGAEAVEALAFASSEGCESLKDLLDGPGAVPDWLICWRLQDGFGEEGVEFSAFTDEVVDDRAGTGRFSHGSDTGSVAADEVNVVLDPLEGGPLVPV